MVKVGRAMGRAGTAEGRVLRAKGGLRLPNHAAVPSITGGRAGAKELALEDTESRAEGARQREAEKQRQRPGTRQERRGGEEGGEGGR